MTDLASLTVRLAAAEAARVMLKSTVRRLTSERDEARASNSSQVKTLRRRLAKKQAHRDVEQEKIRELVEDKRELAESCARLTAGIEQRNAEVRRLELRLKDTLAELQRAREHNAVVGSKDAKQADVDEQNGEAHQGNGEGDGPPQVAEGDACEGEGIAAGSSAAGVD